MPRPLGPEPDEVPVHEQVRRQAAEAHADGKRVVGVVFSRAGYEKAQSQSVPGMDPWLSPDNPSKHYLGLSFNVSTTLTTGDVLLDLVQR